MRSSLEMHAKNLRVADTRTNSDPPSSNGCGANAGRARPRFLFAIDNLRHGGAQKVLRAVLARLDREAVEPAIWCLGGTSDIERWYTELDVEVIRYPLWQMRCGIGPIRMLFGMLRRRPVLVQTFLFHADVLGRALSRLAGVPVVVSSVRATNVRKKGWQFLLDRMTAGLADRIIAVSSATRDFAVAHEGARPEKTVVIPNGIDAEAFEPGREREAVRAELGYGEEEFVVGTIGRLTEQKGHVHLLEAVARLVKSRPEVRAFIVGYGPLESALQMRIEALGLGERVRLLGYRTDVARLLAAMDVFALPSLWEGMSNALLEAMAMALPVVATRVDGNVDLVKNGETGILVDRGDEVALADAIATFADDPVRARKMGRAGRERVEREFSLDRTTEAYLGLYEELLSEKPRLGLTRSLSGVPRRRGEPPSMHYLQRGRRGDAETRGRGDLAT